MASIVMIIRLSAPKAIWIRVTENRLSQKTDSNIRSNMIGTVVNYSNFKVSPLDFSYPSTRTTGFSIDFRLISFDRLAKRSAEVLGG